MDSNRISSNACRRALLNLSRGPHSLVTVHCSLMKNPCEGDGRSRHPELREQSCKRQDYPTASTRIKNCTIPSLVTQIVIPFVRVMSYLHKNDINNKTHTNMYKYT